MLAGSRRHPIFRNHPESAPRHLQVPEGALRSAQQPTPQRPPWFRCTLLSSLPSPTFSALCFFLSHPPKHWMQFPFHKTHCHRIVADLADFPAGWEVRGWSSSRIWPSPDLRPTFLFRPLVTSSATGSSWVPQNWYPHTQLLSQVSCPGPSYPSLGCPEIFTSRPLHFALVLSALTFSSLSFLDQKAHGTQEDPFILMDEREKQARVLQQRRTYRALSYKPMTRNLVINFISHSTQMALLRPCRLFVALWLVQIHIRPKMCQTFQGVLCIQEWPRAACFLNAHRGWRKPCEENPCREPQNVFRPLTPAMFYFPSGNSSWTPRLGLKKCLPFMSWESPLLRTSLQLWTPGAKAMS